MIIKKIRGRNAGPFLGEFGVVLGEGPTVILGTYEDGEERSNRAGKSFFAVDLPMYALFGVYRGSRVEDFPHRDALGSEDAWVELMVEGSDGRTWELRRGRSAGGDPIRVLNGSSVSGRDLSRVVEEEILGLGLDEYRALNAFVQGDMHAFMRASAADKRRLVSPWFNTDRWVPRADLARRRLTAAKAELAALGELEDELTAEATAFDAGENAHTVAGLEVELARVRGKREELEKERVAVAADLKSMEETARRARACERELCRLNAEIKEERASAEEECARRAAELGEAEDALLEARGRRGRLEELRGQEAELARLREDVLARRDAVSETAAELRESRRRREELLARYRRVEKTRTGVCPVLGEECDRVALDPGALTEIRREGLKLKRSILALEEKLKEGEWGLDMARADVRTLEADVERSRGMRDLPTEAEEDRRVQAARGKLAEARNWMDRCKYGRTEAARARKRLEGEYRGIEVRDESVWRSALDDLTSHVVELRAEVDRLERLAAEARARASEAERVARKLEEVRDRRRELSARIDLLTWANYAFGAAGIPSRELENAFGVAEGAMNQVLSEMGTQLRVRFEPTRELREWEPACLACGEPFARGERSHVCTCGVPRSRRRRDELRLEVDDGGSASSFDLDSGGGKVLISLGVRLGLASLPGLTRAVRCEHLLIDEPDGALDAPNRAALHAVIRRLGVLGIRQTLLITHADVKDEFDSVVVVRRNETESRSEVWRES